MFWAMYNKSVFMNASVIVLFCRRSDVIKDLYSICSNKSKNVDFGLQMESNI